MMLKERKRDSNELVMTIRESNEPWHKLLSQQFADRPKTGLLNNQTGFVT